MSLASPESRSSPAPARSIDRLPALLIPVLVAASALVMLVAGAWAFFAPASFADAVGFADGGHFVHDVGAFQIGLGATLTLALFVRDALRVALGGYVVGATFHLAAHVLDGGEGRYGGFETAAVAVTLALAAFALLLQLKGGSK